MRSDGSQRHVDLRHTHARKFLILPLVRTGAGLVLLARAHMRHRKPAGTRSAAGPERTFPVRYHMPVGCAVSIGRDQFGRGLELRVASSMVSAFSTVTTL